MARMHKSPLGWLSLTLLLLAIFSLTSTAAFYLPGTAPVDYEEGSEIPVMGRKLYSLKSDLPRDFYYMPHCTPEEGKVKQHVSLGSLLEGERSELTAYKFNTLEDTTCQVLCRRPLNQDETLKMIRLLKDDYFVRMTLDNMPLTVTEMLDDGSEMYVLGYPIFANTPQGLVFNNHLSFRVLYHRPSLSATDISKFGGDGSFVRIVGFECSPASIQHKFNDNNELATCGPNATDAIIPMMLSRNSVNEIVYTYDVKWQESPITWATRWDHLLKVSDAYRRIQWFSIINSALIVFFLTLLVALVMLRTLWRDFARYNNLDDQEEVREESGWKLVHGDVFRPPFSPEMLAIFVGIGVQLCLVFTVTVFFALLGFFSPANRGGLLTGMLVFWAMSSFVSGFVSAHMYETMGGTRKRTVTLLSSFAYSGLAFAIFFIMNVLAMFLHSTDAVPFLTLVLLTVGWLVVSIPLAYVGGFLGYRTPTFEYPCRINTVPREIPQYSAVPPWVFTIISGILPFGVIFIQLVFIMNSLWQGQLYYMFGFLFLVFVLMSITAAETSIVLTYLTLVNEDYHWWWKSFFASGSLGIYMYIYSIIFLCTQPLIKEMHFVSMIMYLSYMLLISLGATLLAGTIGFYSSFFFVKTIYGAIHVD